MNIRVFELESIITEAETGLTGMLTHWIYNRDGSLRYIFQPHGLNPEDRQPVDRICINPASIPASTPMIDFEVPDGILGSQVEDRASTFAGTAVSFVCHLDGCLHVRVQPKGVVQKTQAPIAATEFDLRRLKGDAIPVMTKAEREQSLVEKPSPAGDGCRVVNADN
jgi:hypothetical protein